MLANNILHIELCKARRKIVLAFFISIVAVCLSACSFDDDTGEYESTVVNVIQRARVVKVKDGDSVILRFEDSTEKEARLFGIDAPEYNQPFGRDAKDISSKLVYKKSLLVESKGTDCYQREIVLLVFVIAQQLYIFCVCSNIKLESLLQSQFT